MTFDGLTLFGFLAVGLMLLFYALEDFSHWFVLAFSAACALAAIYAVLAGTWPFAMVEAAWALVALMRWQKRRPAGRRAS